MLYILEQLISLLPSHLLIDTDSFYEWSTGDAMTKYTYLCIWHPDPFPPIKQPLVPLLYTVVKEVPYYKNINDPSIKGKIQWFWIPKWLDRILTAKHKKILNTILGNKQQTP